MTVENIVLTFVAMLALIYLCVALIRPEEF